MARTRALLRCSFCDKPQSGVAKLIAGPEVYICDQDVEWARAAHGSDTRAKCSFCGKWRAQVDKLVEGPGVFICSECLVLCVEILHNDAIAAQNTAPGSSIIDEEIPTVAGGAASPPLRRLQRALVWALRRTGADVEVHNRHR